MEKVKRGKRGKEKLEKKKKNHRGKKVGGEKGKNIYKKEKY